MARCTAPVQGHRTASGAANCPVCGSRSSYRPSYYTRPAPRYPSSGGDSYTGGRRISVGGRSVLVTAAEERTLAPVRDAVEQQAPSSLPERRDLFLCHALDDSLGAAPVVAPGMAWAVRAVLRAVCPLISARRCLAHFGQD